jgi:hypothetical protein
MRVSSTAEVGHCDQYQGTLVLEMVIGYRDKSKAHKSFTENENGCVKSPQLDFYAPYGYNSRGVSRITLR